MLIATCKLPESTAACRKAAIRRTKARAALQCSIRGTWRAWSSFR